MVQFSWKTDGNFDNQAKFKSVHEYVIAYAKNAEVFPAPPVIDPATPDDSKLFLDNIKNTIVKNGPKNPISEVVLPVGFPASIEHGLIKKRSDSWPHYKNDAIIENSTLKYEVIIESGWSSKDLLLKFISNNCQPVLDAKGQETSFEISNSGSIETVKIRASQQSHVISVLSSLGGPQRASNSLAKMGIVFDGYPKPVELIKYLIKMNVLGDGDIFLDFFAGSGTTGQAIIEQNLEDGGKRKFILVQLPEAIGKNSEAYRAGLKKISDITIERNKRVVERIIEEKKKEQPDLFDNKEDKENQLNGLGFKVFKLVKSNFPRVEYAPDPEKTDEENVEALRKYIVVKEAQMMTAFNRGELIPKY